MGTSLGPKEQAQVMPGLLASKSYGAGEGTFSSSHGAKVGGGFGLKPLVVLKFQDSEGLSSTL